MKHTSLIIIFLILSSCSTVRYPVTDHCDGEQFFNEDRSTTVNKSFFDLIKWKLTGDSVDWPEAVNDNHTPDFSRKLSTGQVAVTFVNHATQLIQFEKFNVITDPVFANRASPFSFVGPKRHRQPGVAFDQLPTVHVVLISHNHYDHMDLDTLVNLYKRDRPQFIVPLGNKKILQDVGIENVVEIDWWQSVKTPSGDNVTLVPMQHWSARGLFDRLETLWGGFVVEASGVKVIFAGDTGYNRHFTEIKKSLGLWI